MNWRHIPVVKHPCAHLLIVQLLGMLYLALVVARTIALTACCVGRTRRD